MGVGASAAKQGGLYRHLDDCNVLTYNCNMNYKSTIVINKEGRWFVARSLELGVVSQGKTIEEAEKNIKEAIGLYLEDQPFQRKLLPKNSPHISWLEI